MRRIFGELNKTEKTFFRGKSTISPWLIVQGKFETNAQILAMRQHLLAAGDLATARNVFSVLCHILRKLFICTSNETFS